MSMWDDEAGYDRDDPKHPGWADSVLRAVEVMKEKRWENLDPREDPEETE